MQPPAAHPCIHTFTVALWIHAGPGRTPSDWWKGPCSRSPSLPTVHSSSATLLSSSGTASTAHCSWTTPCKWKWDGTYVPLWNSHQWLTGVSNDRKVVLSVSQDVGVGSESRRTPLGLVDVPPSVCDLTQLLRFHLCMPLKIINIVACSHSF